MLELILGAARDAPRRSGVEVDVWRDDVTQPFAHAFRDADGYWLEWPGLGRFDLDADRRRVTAWPAPGVTNAALTEGFHHAIQPSLLQACGFEALHASAVATPAGVVVFCGVSGSGKSTLAFALGQQAGCTQIGDDAVVWELRHGEPRVRVLPYRTRLRPTALAHFSAESVPPRSLPATSIPLSAIVLLVQDASAPAPGVFAAVRPASAFSRVLAHALIFDPRDRRTNERLVHDYLCLAERVPVFTLRYPPSFAQLTALVDLIRLTSGAARQPA